MSGFSTLISAAPEYKSVVNAVKRNSFPFGILGLPPTPKALVIHALAEDNPGGAFVIVPDDAYAVKLKSDLELLGTDAELFPTRDMSFIPASSVSRELEQRRTGALAKISEGETRVLIIPAAAAVSRTVPPGVLKDRIFTLSAGDTVSLDEIRSRLVKGSYSFAEMVEGPGQFSVRGGILDIFPADKDRPVRIEFWGDEIDSMAYFDIISQRRSESIKSVSLPPATEILFDSADALADKMEELAKSLRGKSSAAKDGIYSDAALLRSSVLPAAMDKYIPLIYGGFSSVLDYLGGRLLLVADTAAVRENIISDNKLWNEELGALISDGTLCRGLDNFSLPFDKIKDVYLSSRTVFLDNFARGSFDTPVKDLVNFHVNQLSSWDGSYPVLEEDIDSVTTPGATVIVCAGTAKAAQSLELRLADGGRKAVLQPEKPGAFVTGCVNVMPGALSTGIEWPGLRLSVISYGRFAKANLNKSPAKKKKANAFNSLDELQKGDYVVHEVHGIGIFAGIEKVEMEGITKDYIKILYANSESLYVPVTKLELLARYVGPHRDEGEKPIKLSRLGSPEWEKTKTRVRGAVKDIADKLVRIYAERQASQGFAFSPDIDMQNDFERRFEFEETDDQLKCINEIKDDMEKSCPMDRLLCGDVGFGKTEVALRAAFKCVCDGKQVAILVPTTILAYQHYRTIMHRFEGFPVEADMLCRFRTPKQQKEILKKIKCGAVDIITGTHRIISKDVVFKDLGLLIIDEEQRFGVLQKEKLKEKFPAVDVLTLSATPIPRTLNLAIAGIRDLSVIEEPPMDRSPVQTYVLEYDRGVLLQAISKELRRGGQVYYLHNRVEDIDRTAAALKEDFPDASIGVAHGKMGEEELSVIWRDLTEGSIDILVCTTIIETGVDVPNVNTLIIEDADRMGLAQLHQIRGRVGRSTRRASAYLTYKKDKALTEIAENRLDAIRRFTQFGSGLKIALKDLEIRGAGNLLGAQQHGHMEAVGYDMYMQILGEEIAKLRTGEKPYEPKKDCHIDISVEAHIPDSYIESYPQRIGIYKRIADIHTKEDAYDVTDELIDRFGDPPPAVEGLIKVALLKNFAADRDIYEITQSGRNLLLHVHELDRGVIAKLSVMRGRISANASAKPYYSVRLGSSQNAIDCLEEIINVLSAE